MNKLSEKKQDIKETWYLRDVKEVDGGVLTKLVAVKIRH